MDPWMHQHLRLAKERGTLTTPPNSPVQDRALLLLAMLDDWEKESSRADWMKSLALTPFTDWERLKTFWPHYFGPPDPFKDARNEDGTVDPDKVDESKIEWNTPASSEEDEELSRWIAEHENGSFTGADL